MKFLKVFFLVLGISILIAGCGGGGSNIVATGGGGSNQPTTGLVIGKVYDADTNQFIEGAVVTCGILSDTTDVVGGYWIDSVSAGNQTITATATGYDPYSNSMTVLAGETNSHDIYLTQSINSVTLYSTADAYVSDGSPNSNYGSAGGLSTGEVDFGGPSYTSYRAFVKFDVSSIPANAQITKATLYLVAGRNSVPCDRTSSATVTISEVLNTSWTENGLTYINMPSTFKWIYSKTVSNFDDCTSHQHSFDVKDAVQDWVTGTNPNLGLSIKSSSIWNAFYQIDYDYCTIYSKEVSAGAGPWLYVEYTN